MKHAIFFYFLLTIGSLTYGQNIRTAKIEWQVTELFDASAGKTMAYTCKFITQGTAPVMWVQDDGDFASTLTVKSATGDWTNIALIGKFTLKVSMDDSMGDLVFEKNADGAFISLYLKTGSSELRHRYKVSSVTTL